MSRITKSKISGYCFYLMRSIMAKHGFSVHTGSSQLGAKTEREKVLVDKAIEYGRMQAFEQLGKMIYDNSDVITNFNTDTGEPGR